MLAIPLGLGTKLRRAPVVTLAFILAWVVVFVTDRSQDAIFEGVFDAAAHTGFRDSSRDLFVAFCKKQRGEDQRCRELSILVWTGFPGRAVKPPPAAPAAKPRVPVSSRRHRRIVASEESAPFVGVVDVAGPAKLPSVPSLKPLAAKAKKGDAKKSGKGDTRAAHDASSHKKPTRRVFERDGDSDARLKGDVVELKKADKIRRELRDCGESRRCFLYKDIVWRFLDQQQRAPESLAAVDGYRAFFRAQAAFRGELVRICRKHDCLVPKNVTIDSLAWAQLRHSGFLHLFGNALVFLLFGIYVEQRTKRWLYALGLIAGGTAGMAAHAVLFGSGDAIILGGSANVSAALGMFLVFFFRHRMHFQVILPRRLYLGTGFRADVRFAFPLLFLLGDISGQIDSGFADLTSSHVAHAAHLVGFAVGAFFAWVIANWRRVPYPFLYEDEIKDFVALESAGDLGTATARARAILLYNPDNVHAMECGCARFLQVAVLAPAEGVTTPAWETGRQFLATYLTPLVAINLRQGQTLYVVRLLSRLPFWLPFSTYLARLGQVSVLKLGDAALQANESILALRCYELYLTRFPISVKVANVEATAAQVLESLSPTSAAVAAVEQILKAHSDGLLAPRLGAWLANVRASGALASAGRPA